MYWWIHCFVTRGRNRRLTREEFDGVTLPNGNYCNDMVVYVHIEDASEILERAWLEPVKKIMENVETTL